MKQKLQHKGLDVYWFKTPKSFSTWLTRNVDQAESIWLMFAKKGSGERSISYIDARDTALCFGWIDGLINAYSDAFCLRKFSHRRPRSQWSKINRDVASELIRTGAMQPSGLAEVEAARADGRWDAAYDSSRTITVPDDLAALLDGNPAAKKRFDAASRTERYGHLIRLQTAKRPETRARRLRQTFEHYCESGSSAATKPTGRRVLFLLRGVNVGGKNRIKMANLKEAVTSETLADVTTVLQSGNVVARTTQAIDKATADFARRVKKDLGVDADVFSRSHAEWTNLISQNPFASEDLSKVHVTLLDRKVRKRDIDKLQEYVRPGEQYSGRGQTIYFYLPDGMSKTKLTSSLLESKLDCRTTSRNWKTVMRLKDLLDEKT
ncbi:MAG: hypothetical protein Aurels2KO_12440 [Aureliella sp.]